MTVIESEDMGVSIRSSEAARSANPASYKAGADLGIQQIVAEALGTCLILVVTAFLEFRNDVPPLHNDLTMSMKVVRVTLFILIEFAVTGYLATTLISRFALRGRQQRLYPYVCAGLYLVHSSIFFVAKRVILFV